MAEALAPPLPRSGARPRAGTPGRGDRARALRRRPARLRARRPLPRGDGVNAASALPLTAARVERRPVVLRHRARAPRPGCGRGRSRRALRVLRSGARARHGAGLDRRVRFPPTRSGGSPGASSTRASTWRTRSRRPATRASCRHGSASSPPGSGRCPSAGTRATSPRAACRTGSTPGSGSPPRRPSRASPRGSTRRSRAASPSRRPTSGRTSRRPGTTARSSSTRSSSSRWRSRRPIPAATCSPRRSAACTRTCWRTSFRTASTASARPTTTCSRCAPSSARARTRGGSASASRTDSTGTSSARATFALHCHRPDGGIPALSDSDTGSYARAARARGLAARTPRLPVRRDGGRARNAAPPALRELPRRRLLLPAQRLGDGRGRRSPRSASSSSTAARSGRAATATTTF